MFVFYVHYLVVFLYRLVVVHLWICPVCNLDEFLYRKSISILSSVDERCQLKF